MTSYEGAMYRPGRACCSEAAKSLSCPRCAWTTGDCLPTWTPLGQVVTGATGVAFGASGALSRDGNRFATLSVFASETGSSAGQVQVHEWSGTSWDQMGESINGEQNYHSSGYAEENNQGVSISNDGTRIAYGATGCSSYYGCVFVYEWKDDSWVLMGSSINGESNKGAGYSVSLSGDGTRVAIGELTGNNVRVYQWDGSQWSKMGSDMYASGNPYDYAGTSTSLSNNGNVVAFGAPSGAMVQVYEWISGTNSWSKVGTSIIFPVGYMVSLSDDGSRMAVSTTFQGYNDPGFIGVFELQNNHSDGSRKWVQMGGRIYGESGGDKFGKSVSLSGDGSRVAVGAVYAGPEGENSGLTAVYQWDPASNWTKVGYDVLGGAGGTTQAQFGSAVSLSRGGNVLLSTARRWSSYSGFAKVFYLDACNASAPPKNGKVGNCTSFLAHGSSCTPECDNGYDLSGQTTCSFGDLNVATCMSSSNSSSSNSPSSPSSPSNSGNSSPNKKDDAKETKEKAEKTRDAMVNGVTDAKLKKKAKLLADAAISGKKVRKMSAKLTAPDADTACSDYYTKAGLSSSLGACIATAASRRRSLAATTYDVSVFFSEAEVDDSTLTAAENSLKAEGVTGVETSDPIDPITELGTIDGVDSGTLETFKTEASAAAALMPPSPPPPPISPPPPGPPVPNLIQDDDDHAAHTRGLGPAAGHLHAPHLVLVIL